MIPDPECLCFEVAKGEEFIPDFIRNFNVRILSVNLHRPTLDDVFLKLTGREIREEGADELSNLRSAVALHRPRGRR